MRRAVRPPCTSFVRTPVGHIGSSDRLQRQRPGRKARALASRPFSGFHVARKPAGSNRDGDLRSRADGCASNSQPTARPIEAKPSRARRRSSPTAISGTTPGPDRSSPYRAGPPRRRRGSWHRRPHRWRCRRRRSMARAHQVADPFARSTRVDGANSGRPLRPPTSRPVGRTQGRRPRHGGVADDQRVDAGKARQSSAMAGSSARSRSGAILKNRAFGPRPHGAPERPAGAAAPRACRARSPGVFGDETLMVT